jgi:hypothetical protein
MIGASSASNFCPRNEASVIGLISFIIMIVVVDSKVKVGGIAGLEGQDTTFS